MADYYVILKRAIGSLPDGSRGRRQAIYDKARNALLAQLQNMDPPLAPSEISKQRMSLEEAVRAVERDLNLEANEVGASVEGSKAPKTAPVEGSGPSGGVATPKDGSAVARPVSAPAVSVGAAPVAGSSSADKAPVLDDKPAAKDTGNATVAPDTVVRRAGQDVLKNAVRDANALGAATNASVKSAQDAADAVGEQRDNDVARIDPTLGDAVVSKVKTKKENKTIKE